LIAIVIWNESRQSRGAANITSLAFSTAVLLCVLLAKDNDRMRLQTLYEPLSLSAANACHQRTRATYAGTAHLHELDKPPPRVR
jgi:hypothetical protein